MSWLRRKSDNDGTSEDPRIDYARRVVENSNPAAQNDRGHGEHAADVPRGIDSDFCYNEDSGQCA